MVVAPDGLGDACTGSTHIVLVGVVAEVVAARPHSRHRRGARADEGIEHDVALVGVEVDEALRQLHREGRGVPDLGRPLGCQLPHVERGRHELVGRGGGAMGQAFALPRLLRPGAVEATLAGDDHPLGEVAQGGIARLLVRAPGAAAARTTCLLPDDLASQEQPEAVLQDGDDVGGERPVGLAAEVGHVDSDASSRFEDADALGEDGFEHLQVLEVAAWYVAFTQLGLIGLAGVVGRRRDDQRHGRGTDAIHGAAVAEVDLVDHAGRLYVVVVAQDGRREAGVEVGGVVVLAPRDAECRGGCPAPALGSCRHGCQPSLCRCWSLSCCHTIDPTQGV